MHRRSPRRRPWLGVGRRSSTANQGSHFTSEKFTRELEAKQVAISMDGRGRCMDNSFIERLWRSLKYEEVYLKDCGAACLREGDTAGGSGALR